MRVCFHTRVRDRECEIESVCVVRFVSMSNIVHECDSICECALSL